MTDTHRKFAIITVDTNDGDYVSDTIEVTEEQVKMLARVAAAIDDFSPYVVKIGGIGIKHSHNFPVGECLRTDLEEKSAIEYYVKDKKSITEEDFLEFIGLLPYDEYGSHTVNKIKILVVIDEINLL